MRSACVLAVGGLSLAAVLMTSPAAGDALWPPVRSPVAKDPVLEARVDALLARMTLEQKVGQVIQADSDSLTPAEVRRYRLGSVLSGGNSAPGERPYATADEWLAAADAYYQASMDTNGVAVAIPIMWGIDAVHGHNNVFGGTIFPHNIGLGAANNPALVHAIAAATAKELRVTGHDWTFAPTLTVPQDDRWGRTYEGFSEDPALVAAYAPALITGLQGVAGTEDFLSADKVIATAKHFIGDGGTAGGRDQGDARMDEHTLRAVHGIVYERAIAAGVQAIMASFSSWNGRKVHGDSSLLTGVLRERLGFAGMLVGDWNGHGQVETCANESCPVAFNAGLDMFMAPDSWRGLYENTLGQVRSGAISMARLDEAVRRILLVKLRAGLFDADRPSKRRHAGDMAMLGHPDHRALARQAVRESLVLLKNNNQLLPLRPNQRVLVAGDGADNIAKQSGGWTLSWQGGGHGNDQFPKGQSIFSGIKAAVESAGGTARLAVDGRYAERPDVAIVVFGEDPYAEFQGDREHLAYDPAGEKELGLLRRLQAAGIPVVSIFLSGRPLWVNAELNASTAFIAAWLPGTEGGGISDVLFRRPDGAIKHDFSGRLSFSWPRTATQPPQNKGGPDYDPLFAFGYGLRYTDAGDLPLLSEDSGLAGDAATAKDTWFAKGRAVSPWRLVLRKPGMDEQPLAGAEGTSRAGRIRYGTGNRAQQEDTRRLTWLGAAATILLADGEGPDDRLDLRRQANGDMALAIELRIDQPPAAKVMLGVACGPDCAAVIDISAALRAVPMGEWHRLSVPLRCYQQAGADMAKISAPFMLTATAPFAFSFSDIRLASASAQDMACPGE